MLKTFFLTFVYFSFRCKREKSKLSYFLLCLLLFSPWWRKMRLFTSFTQKKKIEKNRRKKISFTGDDIPAGGWAWIHQGNCDPFFRCFSAKTTLCMSSIRSCVSVRLSVGPSFPSVGPSVHPVSIWNDEKRHFLCSDDDDIRHWLRDSQGQLKNDIKRHS